MKPFVASTPLSKRCATSAVVRAVSHLLDNGVLATGLNYPVVPRGDEEIRFQISADHTAADIDEALGVLSRFRC